MHRGTLVRTLLTPRIVEWQATQRKRIACKVRKLQWQSSRFVVNFPQGPKKFSREDGHEDLGLIDAVERGI